MLANEDCTACDGPEAETSPTSTASVGSTSFQGLGSLKEQRRTITFSRRSVCIIRGPSRSKGAGNAESRPPPMARLQTKNERGAVTTVQPDPPGHSLRDGFNGFLRAPPGTGLSCPCRSRDHHLARLTPASGCQDHTTSPSALRLRSSSRNSCVHRSSASGVVTIAIRPSSIEAGCAKDAHISEKRKQDFSQ
jgi:hypothetical protein